MNWNSNTIRRQYFTEFPHFCHITDEVGTLGFDGWTVALIGAVYKGLEWSCALNP